MAVNDYNVPNHAEKTLASDLVRVFDKQLLTDVTFIVGDAPNESGDEEPSSGLSLSAVLGPPTSVSATASGETREPREEIKAHRVILAARSSAFETMFCGAFREMNGGPIPIPDVEPRVFKAMIRYVYSDDIGDGLKEDTVIPLLDLSHRYFLEGLKNECLNYLDSHSTGDSVCSILSNVLFYGSSGQPSLKNKCDEIKEKCLNLIKGRANDVLKSPDFEELPREALELILPDDKLVVDGERAIYAACVKWAKVQCCRHREADTGENLRDHLGSLFRHIRFTNLVEEISAGTDEELNIVLGNIQLLAEAERLALRKYIETGEHEDDPFIKSLNTKKRYTFCVLSRYPSMSPCADWMCEGLPDSLSFQTSEDIVLLGIGIYGPATSQQIFTVKVIVSDHDRDISTKAITRETIQKRIVESHGPKCLKETYRLYFENPVLIQSTNVYSVNVLIDGPNSYIGTGGLAVTTCHDVTFTYQQKSSKLRKGKTSASRGQIPELLFRLA